METFARRSSLAWLAAICQDTISFPGPNENKRMIRSEKKSSLLVIVVSWIIVLIPLGWGVVQSVVKSLPLFSVSAASKTSPRIR